MYKRNVQFQNLQKQNYAHHNMWYLCFCIPFVGVPGHKVCHLCRNIEIWLQLLDWLGGRLVDSMAMYSRQQWPCVQVIAASDDTLKCLLPRLRVSWKVYDSYSIFYKLQLFVSLTELASRGITWFSVPLPLASQQNTIRDQVIFDIKTTTSTYLPI